METVAFTTLLIVTVSAELHFGKYVFIPDALNWKSAQEFCRKHYTDLSPMTPLIEEQLKNQTAGKVTTRFWTGLHWNETHWTWSGGHTDDIPPSVSSRYFTGPFSVSLCWYPRCQYQWIPDYPTKVLPFLCINQVIVERRKSWEAALRSCRQKYTSLTSVTSKTELLLAKTEIQQEHITDRVWIGLRFLRNRWMWVNMDLLEYQAWPEASEDHQCPVEGRCGALTKQGLWENWDCEEKLNFLCS